MRSEPPHGAVEALAAGMRVCGARFILRRILGRGRLGVVWLAQDAKAEHEVALRVLPEWVLSQADTLERLKEQVGRNRPVAHPNIVRTYEFLQERELVAISSECVEGWSLAALRADRTEQRYRWEEISPWLLQLCLALDYAHTQFGLVHLDLKPSNFMLNSRELIKICDFGLVRALAPVAPREPNLFPGPLGFVSPQLARGEEPCVLDDIYSLGATLYDLLTGTPPFYQGATLAQISEQAPPSLAQRLAERGIQDSIPLEVEETILQCLAEDPRDRPKTPGEVLRRLQKSEALVSAKPQADPKPEKQAPAAGELAAKTEASAEIQKQPGTSRRRFLLFGSYLLALSGVCLAAWWRRNSGVEPAAKKDRIGGRDTTFNAQAEVNNEIRSVLSLSERGILVGGRFTQFGDTSHQALARLQPSGAVDGGFTVSANGDVYTLALQPDGQILVAGDFSKLNSHTRRRFARLNQDGTVETGFNPPAGPNREVRAALVQPDGKIVLAGDFDAIGRKKLRRIARFKPDGTRDTSFDPGTGASAVIWSLALQPDAKILAGGDFTSFNENSCGRLVRLNPNGSIDPEFQPDSGAEGQIFALLLQKDGKILIAGDFIQVNGVERNRVARLLPNGKLDLSFKPGAGPNSGVRCLALQPDGRILIGGIFTSVQGVARSRVARLNPDGSLDGGFDAGEGAQDVVRSIYLQSDGNILVAGAFTRFDGVDCARIVRLRGEKPKPEDAK